MYALPEACLHTVIEGLWLRVAVMLELKTVKYNLDRTREFFTSTKRACVRKGRYCGRMWRARPR